MRRTLLAAVIAVSVPALAQDAAEQSRATANSYSYIEASGQLLSFDEDINGANGALGSGLAVSFQPLPYAFGFANISGYRNEGDDAEITIGMGDIGAGLVYPVADRLDVLATAAFSSQSFEYCEYSRCAKIEPTGYTLGAGVRFAINDRFNILAKYENETLDADELAEEQSNGSVKLELAGGGEHHGFVAGAEIDEDGQGIYKLGYRYTFR